MAKKDQPSRKKYWEHDPLHVAAKSAFKDMNRITVELEADFPGANERIRATSPDALTLMSEIEGEVEAAVAEGDNRTLRPLLAQYRERVTKFYDRWRIRLQQEAEAAHG